MILSVIFVLLSGWIRVDFCFVDAGFGLRESYMARWAQANEGCQNPPNSCEARLPGLPNSAELILPVSAFALTALEGYEEPPDRRKRDVTEDGA
jgi:hypothetical protein